MIDLFNHKIGTDYSTVTFKTFGHANMKQVFERLGGIIQTKEGVIDYFHWHFPVCVTPQIIQEVIKNTCYVCAGLMKDSITLQNELVSFNDFDNDADSRGTTQSREGVAKQIKVRKCNSCGHSHT